MRYYLMKNSINYQYYISDFKIHLFSKFKNIKINFKYQI